MNPLLRFYLFILVLTFISKAYSQSYPEVTNLGYPTELPFNGFGVINKTSLKADQSGSIWYSSLGLVQLSQYIPGGVVKYTEGSWNYFHTGNSPLPSDSVYCLMPFGQKLYIGTAKGMAIVDGNWQIIDQSNGLPNNHVRSLLITTESVYVGTNQGLAVLSGNSWTYYSTSNSGISSDTILALELDSDGKLWIGTTEGLCSFQNEIWEVFNIQNSGLVTNVITALRMDTRENLWIGTKLFGLHQLTGSTITHLSHINKYELNAYQTFNDILLAENGDIYMFIRLAGMGGSQISQLVRVTQERVYIYDYPSNQTYLTEMNGLLYFTRSNERELFTFNTSLANLFDVIETLETSEISANFTSTGRIASTKGNTIPHFEIPEGSGKSSVLIGRLWIGGISENNQLHFAGERYGNIGKDYWSGPVSQVSEMSQAEKEKWNAIWSISKDEIDYHRNHWYESSYVIPNSIAKWPAHGDTTLGQSRYIAPYLDSNGNGIYEPLAGDYPVIRGDKAVFFIYNDNQNDHTESGGLPLGVEIHGLAYAYEAPMDSALKHAVFVNYRIINRSENNYDSLFIGNFIHFELGFGYDDFLGCDTTTDSYFVYNGNEIDGYGEPSSYGTHPPSQAVTLLNNPLSRFMSLISFWNTCNLPVFAQKYNLQQAKWHCGMPLVYGGDGFPGGPGSGTERAYHMFPDDPNLTEGWSEINMGNDPGDRRGLASTYIGSFLSGESICYDFAFVFGRDYEGNNLTSVTKMKAHIDQVREFYAQNFDNNCLDLTPTSMPELERPTENKVRCYPNPAGNFLNIEYSPVTANAAFVVYNVLGKVQTSGKITGEFNRILIADLSPGVYIIQINDGLNQYQQKIIKQ